MAEQTDCAGAALTKHPENYLRIGARYWSNQGDMSHQQGSSQFRGDIDVRRPAHPCATAGQEGGRVEQHQRTHLLVEPQRVPAAQVCS